MNQRRAYFFLAIFILIGSSYIFLVTPEVLTIAIAGSENFPLGTLITWAAMISLPLALFYAFPQFKSPVKSFWLIYKRAFQICIALGLLWGVVSYGFSANWNYSFTSEATSWRGSPSASVWFWTWTKVVAALPLVILLFLLLHLAVRWIASRFFQRK